MQSCSSRRLSPPSNPTSTVRWLGSLLHWSVGLSGENPRRPAWHSRERTQQRRYHPRMQDAIAARAVAFPLYNAGSVTEFLENERILSPVDNVLLEARPKTEFSPSAAATSTPSRPRRPPQRFRTRLQLSSSPALRAFYTNAWGKLRIGRLLEDLDALAGSVALRHVALPNVNTVTACVDKIRVLQGYQPDNASGMPNSSFLRSESRPPWSTLDSDLVYTGHLFHVGNTSMTISCEVARADRDSPPFLEAFFVFVARDAAGKQSVQVPGLLLATKADQEAFALGERMAEERRKDRLHKKRATSVPNASANGKTPETASADLCYSFKSSVDSSAEPGIDPASVSIDETVMRTVHIVQPDVRNLFGFMFGGTILLWAFELAYLNVIRHASGSIPTETWQRSRTPYRHIVPRLRAIGDIAFHRPVPIGSVLEMCSRIVAVRDHGLAVRLSARMWDSGGLARVAPVADADLISNTMTFLFQVPANEADAAFSFPLRPVHATSEEQAQESRRALEMLESSA
ncbi:hypothetical protein CCYA_CCYA02G0766 [Cyanidiococcus yangmingshanensis]|nr:hypothetical protein CCYA_CCYA02G0766 [Cyanidiococcus yangmingshanensis]